TMIGSTFGYLGSVVITFAIRARLHIDALEDSLVLTSGARHWVLPKHVFWADAKLFAISPLQPKDRPPFWYELVGPHGTLYFAWVRPDVSCRPFDAVTNARPTSSFEEYDARMGGLMRLIEAKTG